MEPGHDSVRRAFDPWLLAGTCGGIGYAPRAPGTFGALVGIPLSLATGGAATWLATRFTDAAGASRTTLVVEAVLVAIVCALGIPICTRAAARLRRGKDPGAVVFDEAAALPLTLLVVPPSDRSVLVLAAAFVLFRVFDIWKPAPCRQLEGLPAGLGIMADDWGAAAWAAVGLALARLAFAGGGATG
jgi:phosphatidylglycerophosphatase A